MPAPSLHFHDGTLVLKGWNEPSRPPGFTADSRTGEWRAMALDYRRLKTVLHKQGVSFHDQAPAYHDLNLLLKLDYELYPHQREGLDAWTETGNLGSVVLPTGSGKSLVALRAMALMKTHTLIVLPTLDLMHQWYSRVTDAFEIEVGILGGGYHEIRPVTVTTYDSAYRHMDRYGNRFGFLIFDEIHHLPAPSYAQIPELSLAPFRLGLTATYKRQDARHLALTRLIGPVVYEKRISDLKGEHLSDYEVNRLVIPLTPEEEKEYTDCHSTYKQYVSEKGVRFYGNRWSDFIRESAFNPEARQALLARKRMRQILFGAGKKMEVLESIIKLHLNDRIIIFTQDNDLVYRISASFLIPAITHQTDTKERKAFLDAFRSGVFRMLVTSKVLNEGVDIPAANIAVILGGSANPVEHIQRLGRILRKKSGKRAVLYEIIAGGTQETNISYRRRSSDAYR